MSFEKKAMNQLEVFINDNDNISIKQERYYEQHTSVIEITPEQVDILIAWLREAKEALLAERNG